MTENSNERKTFSSIVASNGHIENVQQLWNSTEAAKEHEPVPAGAYDCRLVSWKWFQANNSKRTPGIKITFEICEGEFAGRLIWFDRWLTSDAMRLTKRDLAKIGVIDLKQIDGPVPDIRVELNVSLRQSDSGVHNNHVCALKPLGPEPPDAFASQLPAPIKPNPARKHRGTKK